MRKRVTIEDVAREAGVSAMTVSNVVHSRTGRVGAATREKVLAKIEELGYQANITARNLRSGRTGTIGLAVPDFVSGYYPELARRLADRLSLHGLRLVVERTRSQLKDELDALTASRLSAYDGFVLTVVAGDQHDLEQFGVDAPIILLGERRLPAQFDHVLMDNVAGARLAVDHLLSRGARRVVLLGGTPEGEDSMHGLRTRGYLEAHRAASVAVDETLIVPSNFGIADSYTVTRQLIADSCNFDAIFALTDSSAIGALHALMEAGIDVPDDVQVIGFDNIDDAAFASPSLTTIEPGNDEMADAIVQLLLDRIGASGGPTKTGAKTIMPNPSLVVRQSTRTS